MSDCERQLQAYGELTVKVGLNLRRGQRLLIIGPLASGGVSLEAAPLVRQVVAAAYRAGASLVETIWGDEAAQMARFRHAARGLVRRVLGMAAARARRARRSWTRDRVGLRERSRPAERRTARAGEHGAAGRVQSRPSVPRADLAQSDELDGRRRGRRGVGRARVSGVCRLPSRSRSLWDAIGRLCRLDRPDPVAAWEEHLAALARRRDYLNAKRYSALTLHGAGHVADDWPARRPSVGERAIGRAVRASRSRRTCRPKRCSRCRTGIAWTASCDRRSRSATAAR